MKNYKTAMPILLLGMLVLSSVYVIKDSLQQSQQYTALVMSARQKYSEGLTSEAASYYNAALQVNSTPELLLEVGQMYLDMGEVDVAVDWAEEQLIGAYPKDVRGYEFVFQCYEQKQNVSGMFQVYNQAQKLDLPMDTLNEKIKPYWYAYRISNKYDQIGGMAQSSALVAVCNKDHWGYITPTGQNVIAQQYTVAGPFLDGMAAVQDQSGAWWYIDQNGTNVVSQQSFEDAVSEFQSCGDGLLLVCGEDGWSYYDSQTKTKKFGGYKKATPMLNGVAAVSADGNKWSLISKDGNALTEPIFDEVVTDSCGIVQNGNAVLIRQGDRYYLVDKNGNKITDTGYTDAQNFTASGTYAAVKKDGRWIFVDESGAEQLTSGYDDAYSFCNGVACVKTAKGWSYIDSQGNILIEGNFDDALPFSRYGTSFVKEKGAETWSILSLYRTQNN